VKVLIIQTAFLGDLILTLPIIQTIKKNRNDSIIDVLCIPYTCSILDNNPYVNEVIVFDKHSKRKVSDICALAGNLKLRKYDYAILPHRSFRSAVIAMLSRIENRIAFKKPFFDWLYTETVNYNSEIHEIDRNLSLLNPFGFKTHDRVPELFPSDEDILKVDNLLNTINCDKMICVAPGSKWETKKWGKENYSSLCKELLINGYDVVTIGSKDDVKECEYIKTHNERVINLCGLLTINETAAVIRKSALLVSNDSAPVHIASAAATPVIDIYGPTNPEIGFYPISDKSICLQNKKLDCRPCSIHGGKVCPTGTLECMTGITPEIVFGKVTDIFNEQNN
jgi:heptosyltransferase-2